MSQWSLGNKPCFGDIKKLYILHFSKKGIFPDLHIHVCYTELKYFVLFHNQYPTFTFYLFMHLATSLMIHPSHSQQLTIIIEPRIICMTYANFIFSLKFTSVRI
jgi:hypothetical protein